MGPGESKKPQLIYQWLRHDTLQPKFDEILFFSQHFQTLYEVMLNEVENIEFVQGVAFNFIESRENKGINYLLFFDDSCQKTIFREFEKVGVAGSHRGVNTIYLKHNLFHLSIIGRVTEMQNTHIVLFKSPRDLLHFDRLSVQLGLVLSLVGRHKDATSVPFGHLSSDLPLRSDDRLRYCTNSGKNTQNSTYLNS